MRRSATAAIHLLSLCMLLALAGPAGAQPVYPGKPIRLIAPYAPGGSTTVVARLIGQKLSESWGQQVLVENRPGGNTIIGSEAMVRSAPDGYTILLVTSTHAINAGLVATPYDAIKDFAPVATLVATGYLLVLHPSLPASNLREFIALAKSRPGQLDYASSGAGTANHLAAELFSMLAGVRMQHIPYKGGGPAMIDLIAGQVQVHFNVPIGLIASIRNAKLKGVAVTGEARLAALPEVPTFSEAGLAGFDATNWNGILAPARTPKAVIDKLATEIARILALPEVREKLLSQGADPYISTPEQFAALIRADIARFTKVIKSANIKLE